MQTIAKWEGGQWLHGYVPIAKKTDRVVGASGMTVATGYDLGQHTAAEWTTLSDALIKKIKPFAGHPFRRMLRSAVIAEVKKLGPLPLLTKPEADDIDRISFPVYLTAVIRKWDGAQAHGPKGLPKFRELPSQWQTVLLSRQFNAWAWTAAAAPTHAFWVSAIAGEWDAAVRNLRAAPYADQALRNRVGEEADFLQKGMPAALPKPPGKPGVGGPALPGHSARPGATP